MRCPKLGQDFISVSKFKKKGVVVYIHLKYEVNKIFNDHERHCVIVELIYKNQKSIIVGLYGPLENKGKFY